MKKKIIITMIGIAAVLLLAIGAFVSRLVYQILPSKGEIIAEYENPKSAILVIDIQNGTTQTEGYAPADKLIEEINTVIAYGQERDMEIVYITQEYRRNPWDMMVAFGKFLSGTESVKLDERLDVVSDVQFSKWCQDAFTNPDLNQYLEENQIDTLYLVGVDAYACVMRTAAGALNRGYHVYAVKECIGTQMAGGTEGALEAMENTGVKLISEKEMAFSLK